MAGLILSDDPSKDAFNSKVYLAAAILDPNLKLHWLEDVNIPTYPEYDEDLDSRDELRQELTSKCSRKWGLNYENK